MQDSVAIQGLDQLLGSFSSETESNSAVQKTEESSDSTDSGNISFFIQTSSEFPTPRNSSGMIQVLQVSNPPLGDTHKRPDSRFQIPTPIGSVASLLDMNSEERELIIRKNFTVMFSCIYAAFLVVAGGVVYINYEGKRYISEIFSSFTALVGMAWLLFFHLDLFRYKRRVLKQMVQKTGEDSMSTSTDINLNMGWDSTQDPPYRFLTGRHSGSFYLKTGLAAFCFGHLINEGLQLGQEILNYAQEDRYAMNCGQISSVVLHCIRPIYSFYQLFIVFKYSNIVINRYKEVARFALMHMMATCLCFWFSTIVQDALEDYHHKLAEMEHKNLTAIFTKPNITDAANITRASCASNAILSVNNLQAIPYLYPFTVEFNLLLAGVWFIVWNNIGKDHHRANPHHFRHKINNEHGIEEVTYQSNLVISADCHASNKGLFLGLFLLMTSIISIIVFFVAMSSQGYISVGVTIHTTQEATLAVTSLVGVILAYRQLSQLDFNKHPITFLDDVFLFIPLPFYFVHAILSVIADLQENNITRMIMPILTVGQVVLQTPVISDGLRRCSNTHGLRYKKPGREIVTFLIVCNLTMWIINTFEAKSVEPHYAQHDYFGEFLWMFINHTTLPVMLFYRFHSSVCLADIWKSAYEKGE